MVLTLIHLLQGQAAKVSWLLWTAAILFFLAGLALLVYLMTRSKGADQLDELEDNGGGLLSREKLLDEIDEKKSEAQDVAVSVKEEKADAGQTIPLFSEADFSKHTDNQPTAASMESDLASFVEQETPTVSQETLEEDLPAPLQTFPEQEAQTTIAMGALAVPENAAPEIQEEREAEATPAVSQTLIEPTSVVEERETQILTSQKALTVEPKPLPLVAQEEPIFSPQEEALLSQEETLLAQENSSARVDTPASPQRLEQAATFRREPFEPPTIEPMAPQQTATQQLSSQHNILKPDESRQSKTTALSSQPSPKQTAISSSEAALAPPQIFPSADSGTLPLSSAQTSFPSAPHLQGQAASPLWEAQGARTRSTTGKPAGSVLGLPAETSHAPLILGQPSRDKDEEGVAALSNYDKDLDAAETGRGGAITLLIAILLIGGAALAYFFVPAIHSRADALVARIRGQQPTVPVEKPKAQVYPSRNPEVIKNLVKARGAVTNISEETLEDLYVEVSLDRGEGTAGEVRAIPVKPNVLVPRQQGLYEFEYEGGKATGFSRYRVTKLLSKNGEVKFTTPSQ